MKIYTRTGDDGTTSLFSGGRTRKDSARLHAYGTVDELNSILGLTQAHGLAGQLPAMVTVIQNELFAVGADLATPLDAQSSHVVRVEGTSVTRLEREIDKMDEELTPLKSFILPGGSVGAGNLHIARTVCRRAERWVVTLADDEPINRNVQQYLNRLSDWFFTAARYENHLRGVAEPEWRA